MIKKIFKNTAIVKKIILISFKIIISYQEKLYYNLLLLKSQPDVMCYLECNI